MTAAHPPRTLGAMLEARAAETPSRCAVGFLSGAEGVETLDYAGLDRGARAVAGYLQEHGVRPGDRVLLAEPPGLPYVTAFFGCVYAGALPVPCYPLRPGRTATRLAHIFKDSGARTALVARSGADAGLAAALGEHVRLALLDDAYAFAADRAPRVEAAPEDAALLQYTSGSTLAPKGVRLTHRSILANLAQVASAFGHSERSVGVNWLPPYHDMGLIGTILQPIFAGFPTYLMSPLTFVQRPLRWLQAVTRLRATTVGGPAFALDFCAERVADRDLEGIDLSSVDVFFCGAEPIHHDTLERFAARFAGVGLRREALYPCYGLAEATLFVTGVARGAGYSLHRPAGGGRPLVSCGVPADGTRVRIVDPERAVPLPDGEIGEIWVAGPSVADGYWERPDATRETFGARLAGDDSADWLRTGDLGMMAAGALHPCGRIKEVLIHDGRKLASEDLEHCALVATPGGAERRAVALSLLDAEGRERIGLAVEVGADAEPGAWEDVATAVRGALLREHEVPLHELVLLRRGALYRTTSGKVERGANRRALRDREIVPLARWTAAGGWQP